MFKKILPTFVLLIISIITLFACGNDDENKSYTLTLLSNNQTMGTVSSNGTTFKPLESITITATPNESYEFINWTQDNAEISTSATYAFVMPNNDVVITGNFKAIDTQPENKHTVIFDSNDGSIIQNIILNHDSLIQKPADPTRSGYIFEGWYKDDETFADEWNFNSDTVIEDITLFAKWKVDTRITITFDSNEGSSVQSIILETSGKITKPNDPTRSGYTFDGWYKDDNTFKNKWDFSTDTASSSITLFAKWIKINSFTVTFNSNGGTSVTSISVTENSLIPYPDNPTKTDHYLDGWYKDNNTFKLKWNFLEDVVTEPMTLHAKWVEDFFRYDVTLTSNLDVALVGAGSHKELTDVVVTAPEVEGYTFGGWFVDGRKHTDKLSFTIETISKDHEYHALYVEIAVTPDNYLIKFDFTTNTDISSGKLKEYQVNEIFNSLVEEDLKDSFYIQLGQDPGFMMGNGSGGGEFENKSGFLRMLKSSSFSLLYEYEIDLVYVTAQGWPDTSTPHLEINGINKTFSNNEKTTIVFELTEKTDILEFFTSTTIFIFDITFALSSNDETSNLAFNSNAYWLKKEYNEFYN